MKKAIKIIKNDHGVIEEVYVVDTHDTDPNAVDEFYHFDYEVCVVGENWGYIDPIELSKTHGLMNSINIIEAAAEVMITDERYYDFVMDRLCKYHDYGFVTGFLKIITDFLNRRMAIVDKYQIE